MASRKQLIVAVITSEYFVEIMEMVDRDRGKGRFLIDPAIGVLTYQTYVSSLIVQQSGKALVAESCRRTVTRENFESGFQLNRCTSRTFALDLNFP